MKIIIVLILTIFYLVPALADECVDCHQNLHSGIIKDWKASKHFENDILCGECHGDEHTSINDVDKATLPTLHTCENCHEERVEQFTKGKHSKGWASMNAMPTVHMQPKEMIDGKQGCGGCHKLGIKSETDLENLKKSGNKYGVASCDVCHTRHLFSKEEALQPQACQTCHMGFDHPQWEMYSSSKHGTRNGLKQMGILPDSAIAPKCQMCHMPDGNHEVRATWGYFSIRLPLPKDKQWAADQTTILKALGVLSPTGEKTDRFEVLKELDVIRTSEESWNSERAKMLKVCQKCHSGTFAKNQMEKGDAMVKQADRLMAQAINIVADLYKDGILKKAEFYNFPYPDLITFHDSPTVIENKLFVMFLEHRMRTIQGTFHVNPDYAYWYGWSEMKRDLKEIEELAHNLKLEKKNFK